MWTQTVSRANTSRPAARSTARTRTAGGTPPAPPTSTRDSAASTAWAAQPPRRRHAHRAALGEITCELIRSPKADDRRIRRRARVSRHGTTRIAGGWRRAAPSVPALVRGAVGRGVATHWLGDDGARAGRGGSPLSSCSSLGLIVLSAHALGRGRRARRCRPLRLRGRGRRRPLRVVRALRVHRRVAAQLFGCRSSWGSPGCHSSRRRGGVRTTSPALPAEARRRRAVAGRPSISSSTRSPPTSWLLALPNAGNYYGIPASNFRAGRHGPRRLRLFGRHFRPNSGACVGFAIVLFFALLALAHSLGAAALVGLRLCPRRSPPPAGRRAAE